MSTLPIVFPVESDSGTETLGILTPGEDVGIKEVDAEKVRQSLADLAGKISGILDDVKSVGEFKLDTVQLAVQISAEGGVALVANAKAGMSGTITLTFSR
jgi:hypothetical protein